MRIEEARELAAAVRRVRPEQEIPADLIERWPGVLTGLTFSECLMAVASLALFKREIWANDILGRAQTIRRARQEPAGDIWKARLARHGGREFDGGAVCWNPAEQCEGVCKVCPRDTGEAAT